jgi:hypothetical protein
MGIRCLSFCIYSRFSCVPVLMSGLLMYYNASHLFCTCMVCYIIAKLAMFCDTDCNCKVQTGNSALMLAIQNDQIDCARLLIDAGADKELWSRVRYRCLRFIFWFYIMFFVQWIGYLILTRLFSSGTYIQCLPKELKIRLTIIHLTIISNILRMRFVIFLTSTCSLTQFEFV